MGDRVGLRSFIVKLLNYTFVGMLGAALASWVTYRLNAPKGPAPSPVPVHAEFPNPAPPAVPSGPAGAELERLNREKSDLAAELAEARLRLARSDAALTLAHENLDELRRPMTTDLLSSALSAELKSGEVVVTGGYRLPDGTRLYAFVQPTLEQIDGADRVRITSSVRAVADDAGASVGLSNLATNADNTLQHGEVWLADERRVVFEALDALPGARTVSLPEATVLPGVSSVIEFGELRLKVTPARGADADSLDFEVRVEQARPAPPDEAEAGSSPVEVPALAQ